MNTIPTPIESKPPPPEKTPPVRFTTAEVSFFDTGQAIETGQIVLPEATSRQRGRIRRWVRHSPGLAAGFACAVLVVVGFWVGGGVGGTPPVSLVKTAPAPTAGVAPASPAAAAPMRPTAAAPNKPRPAVTKGSNRAPVRGKHNRRAERPRRSTAR
jgi:hypothetical protein